MGMFSATCGLSGLPIEEGDDVRTFLTVRRFWEDSPGLSGRIENLNGAAPFTLALRGEYSGYGYPYLEENYNTRIVAHRLDIHGDWHSKRGGWEGFWGAMASGDLMFDEWGIGLLMVRVDVLRSLVEDPPPNVTPDEADREFLKACYEGRGEEYATYSPSQDLLPIQMKLGVYQEPLEEVFPLEEVLYYDPPKYSLEDIDEFLETGEPPENPSSPDPLVSTIGGQYMGMERGSGIPVEDRVQYKQDKIEFVYIQSLMRLLGEDWIAPPHGMSQFPDWRDFAEIQRVLTNVARSRVGDSRYEADLTRGELEKWLHVRSEMTRRAKRILEEEHEEDVEVTYLDLKDLDTVSFKYEVDGETHEEERSSEWVYDP